MSTKLVSCNADTGVDKIATTMALKMVSALPVVDEYFHVRGLVSEGDLLSRADTGTLPRRSWWLRWFGDADKLAKEYTKTHESTAADIMIRQVACVGPGTPVEQIADIPGRRTIMRVPVLEDGKLVGIVSRADIIQLVALRNSEAKGSRHSDNEIQDELLSRLRREAWASTQFLSFSVREGVVAISGLVASSDRKQALNVLMLDVPGIREFCDTTTAFPVAEL